MKIGELARCGEVNVQTVRFYERRGLLPDPRAGVSGYRDYDDHDLERLRFIREAQALGFTLREVEELLAIRAGRGAAADVRRRAQQKVEQVREKIRALRRLERNLLALVATCPGAGSAGDCPILGRIERATDAPAAGSRSTSRGSRVAPSHHRRRK